MSRTLVSSFRHAGLDVEIHVDEDVRDPRKEFDHTATLCLSHRRYSLVDELDAALYELEDPEAYLREEYDAVFVTKVYGYDHGSLRVAITPFSCAWDSGVLGYAFVTKADMDKGFGEGSWTEEQCRALIASEVEEYDQYLNGDVYGYVVLDNDGETLDSCWGFYGLQYAQEQGREAADSENRWLVDKAEGEAYALLQALETPDVVTALAAARQGVR